MRALWILVVALPLVLAVHPAFAEDDAPPFGAADLAVEEDLLPKGWKILYDEVDDTPGEAIEAWAIEVASAAGVDEDDLLLEIRVLESPEKAHATLLVIEMEGDPSLFQKRLEIAAKDKAWFVKPLGHPTRILVIASPAALRKQLELVQELAAVKTLTRLAYERLDAGSLRGAERFAKGALAVSPKAETPHAVVGLAASKEERWDDAIKAFEKAFAGKSDMVPEERLAHWSWRTYAYSLLQRKEKASDQKAIGAFEKAIATVKYAEKKEPVFPIFYNLACTYARLGKTKEACERLEEALLMAKKRLGPQGFRRYVEGTVSKDEDFEKLRNEPCFEEVLDRVTSDTGRSPLDGI